MIKSRLSILPRRLVENFCNAGLSWDLFLAWPPFRVNRTSFYISRMSLHAQMAPSYSAEIAAIVDKTRHAILSKINTTTVSERQGKSLKDPGVQARMWVSRVVLAAPQPENGDACQRICDAISYLGKGNEEYKVPAMLDVAAEWTGYRPRVDDNAPEPSIPEVEKFNGLMRDVENQITILYLHGGAFL